MYSPCKDYKNHKDEYDNAVLKVMYDGNFINGIQIKELEQRLSEYIGDKEIKSIAVSSGTDALLIALMALGIKENDEVITVAHTWISSSEVISLIGAIPVFIDIDKDTCVMDVNIIEKYITKNTKAILYVNLYGNMPDIDKLLNIAKKNSLWVIEDAAQSFGSTYKGMNSGNFGDISCSSFFPSKPLGAYGDAGACFTKNLNLYDKMCAIRNHGGLERFKHNYIGINGRMDTIQAAILLVKLKYFKESLKRRQEIAKIYDDEFQEFVKDNIIKIAKLTDGVKSSYAQYSIIVIEGKNKRDNIVNNIKKNNINISIFYPIGLHKQKCFENVLNKYNIMLDNTDWICDHIFQIPLYPELTDDEIKYIINTVKNAIKNS